MNNGFPEDHVELHELRIKSLDNVLSAIAESYSWASFPFVYSQLEHAAENIRVAKVMEESEYKNWLLKSPETLNDLPLFKPEGKKQEVK